MKVGKTSNKMKTFTITFALCLAILTGCKTKYEPLYYKGDSTVRVFTKKYHIGGKYYKQTECDTSFFYEDISFTVDTVVLYTEQYDGEKYISFDNNLRPECYSEYSNDTVTVRTFWILINNK